jgi:tetratricopeptide (TPR) repeat protein
VLPITPVPYTERRKQQDQAIRLWHQIVNLPPAQVPVTELASAYSGLCKDGLDQAAASQVDPLRNPNGERQGGWLTYFYCYKSQTLLERLPNPLYSQEKIRQAVAENLNNLGLIIDLYSGGGTLTGWHCLPFEISEETGALAESVSYGYSRSGLQFYQKALELRPQDIYIQCNAAINAKLLKIPALMDDLERNPQSHYELANGYLARARRQSDDSKEPSPYYQAAITAYKKAIDLDPMYHEALHGYAYTYWVFRLQWPDASLKNLGPQFEETLPAYYASKALHLARVQQVQELEVIYGSTLAEVLLAQGQPQRAVQVLMELEEHIPESYMFDYVRWDMAQAFLCSIDENEEGSSREEMEEKAEVSLSKIREHEQRLEISLFSQPGKNWLQTSYRLPFCSPSNSP